MCSWPGVEKFKVDGPRLCLWSYFTTLGVSLGAPSCRWTVSADPRLWARFVPFCEEEGLAGTGSLPGSQARCCQRRCAFPSGLFRSRGTRVVTFPCPPPPSTSLLRPRCPFPPALSRVPAGRTPPECPARRRAEAERPSDPGCHLAVLGTGGPPLGLRVWKGLLGTPSSSLFQGSVFWGVKVQAFILWLHRRSVLWRPSPLGLPGTHPPAEAQTQDENIWDIGSAQRLVCEQRQDRWQEGSSLCQQLPAASPSP